MASTLIVLDYMFHGVRCSEKEYNYLLEAYKGVTNPFVNEIENSLQWFRDGCPGPKVSKQLLESAARHEVSKLVEPQVASSVEATLAQRGSRYGDFTDHARLCQALQQELQEFKPISEPAGAVTKWEKLSPVQRQALTVIMDKVARILTGDPNYDDNWHDIQGYAKLVEDRLPKKESH
jgi:hypothetical protein